MYEMGIEKVSFASFEDKVIKNKEEGLVLLGCGGDKVEWIDGVTTMLQEQDIIPKGSAESLWGDILELTTNGGRSDIVLIFRKDVKYDLGRMAIWRLNFGECSWVSDYLVNFEGDHILS